MNLELVEQIVVLLGEYPVSEIAVELENCRVHVRKPLMSALPVTVAPPEATPSAETQPVAEELPAEPHILTAPMVGIFYHTQPPLPFTAEITSGQVVGSIESMKLMNAVTADTGGRITDILVEDGAPVEYGQALFRLAAL
jgi:acetyl-CoA carboxylase biotin carboxyl carrier protein